MEHIRTIYKAGDVEGRHTCRVHHGVRYVAAGAIDHIGTPMPHWPIKTSIMKVPWNAPRDYPTQRRMAGSSSNSAQMCARWAVVGYAHIRVNPSHRHGVSRVLEPRHGGQAISRHLIACPCTQFSSRRVLFLFRAAAKARFFNPAGDRALLCAMAFRRHPAGR